ncbi:ralBP1-associated Eps domain-containing protein 1 [Sitophilus oryzae]|uniref:RalBP1-associated Eps domain-containing protein 1 n=1 Tax=Sitophilus oryzae TaxID=7048 RepID=A0A6J2YV69_SITOR|nr:ralBP1-associated Eps domain-containing protein 1 [Sitophilus oryzae]
MDELHLSDTFQRYFSDIFLCCDEEKSGKASLTRTIELVKSGNIPDDVIAQIAEICWTPGTNYLNKKQFFSALKLVAAYQSNLPIRNNLINSKLDLPLPRFTWGSFDAETPIPDLIELRNEPEYNTDSISTDSEADSETVRCSPNTSSPASDSPTPTNSVQDRNWAWQGLVSEEQRQLLEEESSDRHSSDEDTDIANEVWVITPEQKEYYTKQFKQLQENTNALLAGPIARTFFERSQLPVHELRKIWQLADVTKDGALSLQEFCTAMHLVVLRKHKISIPDTLPSSLVPQNDPLPVIKAPPTPPEPEPIPSPTAKPTKETAKEWTKFVDSPTRPVSPVNFDFQIDQNDPDLRHPVPRRLTPEMVAAANAAHGCPNSDDVPDAIDLHSPRKSEGIPGFQSLSSNNQQHSAIQRPQPKKINARGPGAIPPPPEEGGPVSLPAFPPVKKEKPPPPPPRTFKTHGRSSSLDLNRLTKPSAPPMVPPRISPSGQIKKLPNQRSEGDGVPSLEGTDASFADFNRFEKYENVQDEPIFPGDLYEAERKKLFAQLFAQEPIEEPPRKHGAFEVYRKPGKSVSGEKSPLDALEEEQWQEFERLQIENTALLRTCQELSQQLADLKEDKMKLKVKLEQLEALQNGG